MKLKNRKIASVACVVMVVVSILLSARFEMSKIQNNLNAEYNREVGIKTDLEQKAKDAANLIVIAEKYNVDSSDLSTMREAVLNSKTEEAASNSAKMDQAFDYVVSNLMNQDLSEKDASYLTQIHGDYYASNDRIERDAYYTVLDSSIERLSQFPANVFRFIFKFDLKNY